MGIPTAAIVQTLASIEVFRDFDAADLDRLRQVARLRELEPGTALAVEGQQVEGLMILVSGRAAVRKVSRTGETQELSELVPGAILGEMSLLLASTAGATVVAVEPTAALLIDRVGFERITGAGDGFSTRFSLAMARTLASRLRQQNELVVRLLDAYGDPRSFDSARSELEWRWEY